MIIGEAAVCAEGRRACASSEARSARHSSCTRQAAESSGFISGCSSSAAGPGPTLLREDARLERDRPPSAEPSIMEKTAPTHLLTMGDRRFRRAALPAPSARSVKVLRKERRDYVRGKGLKDGRLLVVGRLQLFAQQLGENTVGIRHTRQRVMPRPLAALEQGALEQLFDFADHAIDRVHKAPGCGGEFVHEDIENRFHLGVNGALLLIVIVAPVVAVVVVLVVGRRHRRVCHAAHEGLCSPGPAQGARGGALRRLEGSECGVLEGGVFEGGAREVCAAQFRAGEVCAARLGPGQVGGPGGVAHADFPVVIIVLAALGKHAQVGAREVGGYLLLKRLRLVRRRRSVSPASKLREEGALWEGG
eukprot:scaffold5546_cov65-Phaeocystis_antarctica.AAC.3